MLAKSTNNRNFYREYRAEKGPLFEFGTLPPHFLFYQHIGFAFASDCPLGNFASSCNIFLKNRPHKFRDSAVLQAEINELHESLVPFIKPGVFRDRMMVLSGESRITLDEVLEKLKAEEVSGERDEKINVLQRFIKRHNEIKILPIKELLRERFVNNESITFIKTKHPDYWNEYLAAKKERDRNPDPESKPKNFYFVEAFCYPLWKEIKEKFPEDKDIKEIIVNEKLDQAYEALDDNSKKILKAALEPHMALTSTARELPDELNVFYQKIAKKLDILSSEYDPIYAAAMLCYGYNSIQRWTPKFGQYAKIENNF